MPTAGEPPSTSWSSRASLTLLARWRAEGLTRQDVFEALHEQGIETLDQVERIYLEESGRITVVPRTAPAGAA